MFIGEFQYNIDSKGRISMPAEFRELLGEEVFVTKGLEGCLTIYSIEEFQQIYKELQKLKVTDKKSREYLRVFSSNTQRISFDKAGRLNLSNKMVELADLKKSCMIVGMLDHLELWDKDRWSAYYNAVEGDYEDNAGEVFKNHKEEED